MIVGIEGSFRLEMGYSFQHIKILCYVILNVQTIRYEKC